MEIRIPKIIKKYIKDESTVPLVKIKGVLWYSITEEEKNALVALAAALDAMPGEEWERLTDSEKWEISSVLNDAERIAKNSVIRPT